MGYYNFHYTHHLISFIIQSTMKVIIEIDHMLSRDTFLIYPSRIIWRNLFLSFWTKVSRWFRWGTRVCSWDGLIIPMRGTKGEVMVYSGGRNGGWSGRVADLARGQRVRLIYYKLHLLITGRNIEGWGRDRRDGVEGNRHFWWMRSGFLRWDFMWFLFIRYE